MRKLVLAMLSSVALVTNLMAADFVQDTRKYFLNSLSFGYFEHFCEKEKTHEGVISVPLAAYGVIGFDAFGRVGSKNNEIGMSFPTMVNSWMVVTPLIYNDFTAQDVGIGLTFSMKLRK